MTDSKPKKVTIIGSGNWGSAIARNVGLNCEELDEFDNLLRMWVFEEIVKVDGKDHKLTEYINTHHENVRYLPGILLPKNLVAVPDVFDAIRDSSVLIFVIPHQFIKGLCQKIKPAICQDAIAISLCKDTFQGFELTDEGLIMISSVIREELGIPCGALMGANLAGEVARDFFAEATIATDTAEQGEILSKLFARPLFRVSCVRDIVAVEICGALKNIIAVGAGFVDALGMGNNTKSAIIRIGLMEMMAFSKEFYSCADRAVFFESCGIADLVTTCYGGRHPRLAKEFVLTGKSFEELEAAELNGQKLQGPHTAQKVFQMLSRRGQDTVNRYPLLVAIYRVAYEGMPAADLFKCIQLHPEDMIEHVFIPI